MGVVRGRRKKNEQGYEDAESGTIYWTLSLYIEPDSVVSALTPKDAHPLGKRIEPETFRRLQRGHLPSLALANAIDPLMNDIADRESQGEVKEFLLAATDRIVPDMRAAAAVVREHETLTFEVPKATRWATEGVQFEASPENLDHEREVRLRRFWLSHNNGALSYHLSFSHYYGTYDDGTIEDRSGHDPSTYYFLSLLQKLAAPKEYALKPEFLTPKAHDPDPQTDVFQEGLDIDPLDSIQIRFQSGRNESRRFQKARFWPFVEAMFEDDAEVLFQRLANASSATVNVEKNNYRKRLLELVPFIEVPGLKAPKSRFMFMLHDERFFDRLMPLDPVTKETAARKVMVREECYAPYEARIGDLMKEAEKAENPVVRLDTTYWNWAAPRPEYEQALKKGGFVRVQPPAEDKASTGAPAAAVPDPVVIEDMDALVSAMQAGVCEQTHAFDDPLNKKPFEARRLPVPVRHHIPAFAANRSDCLDYLFLAGFNQNIIDFMNQDTSEILDSIDPIYPDSSEQTDERFFVRYANHRAMITYVPKSRSLDAGNDYIGACPYAFLIHALALHNEFLARGHEQKTMARIERIEARLEGRKPKDSLAMQALNASEPLIDAQGKSETDDAPLKGDRLLRAMELAINRAKLAEFSEYERYRYANPFRYDTERDVFEKLEQLRGVSRKNDALTLAIESLDEHASDLQRQQEHEAEEAQRLFAAAQQRADKAAEKQREWLNLLLGMTGVFGAGQMFYWIGEKAADEGSPNPIAQFLGRTVKTDPPRRLFGILPENPSIGEAILTTTEFAMFAALTFFLIMLARGLWRPALQLVFADLPDIRKNREKHRKIWRRRIRRSLTAVPKRRRKRSPGVSTRGSEP